MEANGIDDRQDMQTNSPYLPPSETRDLAQEGRWKLRLPAILFLIVCILGIAFDAVYIFDLILSLQRAGDGGAVRGVGGVSIGIRFAWQVFFLLAHLVILNAACDIVTRKNYAKSVAVCKFAFVPYVTPLVILGIPFAVWTYYVLRDSRVKQAFESQVAGGKSESAARAFEP